MKRLLTLMLVALLAIGAGTAYSAEGDSNFTRLVIEATSGGMIKDSSGNIVLASGTTVPSDTTSGYAKGATFLDTDVVTGTSGFYTNVGTTTSCNFDLVEAAGAFTPSDLTLADGKIIVGNAGGVGMPVTPSGDIGMLNSGAVTVNKIKNVTLGTVTPTNGEILIANGVSWNSEALTGDYTITNAGVGTVGKINGVSPGSTTATSAHVLIGDGTKWQHRAISGDTSLTSAGVTAILANKVKASNVYLVNKTLVIASGTAYNSTPYDGIINSATAYIIGLFPTSRTGTDRAILNSAPASLVGGVIKLTLNTTAAADQTWMIRVLAP